LFTAEYHKNSLIAKALTNHNPDCISIGSFLGSLNFGGQEFRKEHALFTESGKAFFGVILNLNFLSRKRS